MGCGFDSELSLCSINEATIGSIEKHVDENPHILENLDCIHKQIYEKQTKMKFVPGHHLLLLNIPECVKACTKPQNISNEYSIDGFSAVLKAMAQTAENNYRKPPNTRRYPKLLMDFGIYTYLSCGKACYKMLAANLPLPKDVTICECL